MKREDFMKRASERLAGLTGAEYAAEVERLQTEMDELIRHQVHTEHQKTVARLESTYIDARRKSEARQLARQLARPGCDNVLMPHLLDRIQVTRDGDGWAVTARSSTGVETSLEGLVAELKNTPAFEPVVIGSSAIEKAEHAKKVAETLGLSTATH